MPRQGEKKTGYETGLETRLVESEDAVFDLLESLLQEVDVKPEEKLQTVVKTDTEIQPATQTELKSETTAETSVEAEFENQAKSEQDSIALQPEQLTENVKIFGQLPLDMQERLIAQATEELKIKNSLPDWVEHTIPCLLVDVEGMELAVPLILLSGIAVWDQETLPMPNQPDWHLGVIEYRGENVVVVDTALLTMPERVSQSADERRANHPSHFLRVGANLALSCDDIKETVSMKQDEIRWRITRNVRPWAVGILIERLSVLLDTDELLKAINKE